MENEIALRLHHHIVRFYYSHEIDFILFEYYSLMTMTMTEITTEKYE